MAFSPESKLSICKILGVNPIDLDVHLAAYADSITSVIETAVQDEIDRWDKGIGTKFMSVEPNTKNFGAKLDPEAAKNDVRQNIRSLLIIPESMGTSSGSSDSFEIARG